MRSPLRAWHGRLVTAPTTRLMAQAPAGFSVELEMTIRLDARNSPEPDLLLTKGPSSREGSTPNTHVKPTALTFSNAAAITR